MYNNGKKTDVSTVKQREDKSLRYDYNRINIHIPSGIRGDINNIMESR